MAITGAERGMELLAPLPVGFLRAARMRSGNRNRTTRTENSLFLPRDA